MNQNYRRKTEKVYVKVNSDFDATGYMQPRQITWGDGRTYPIEQVRDFRPANTIADMPGDCYTIMVRGRNGVCFSSVPTHDFHPGSADGSWRWKPNNTKEG